ncbi:hypothetical protein EC957_009144 [Mortierella hygrophila]|uniref:Uncharacterized protein n=1 Tax=Mortierella hygrophila TaxID=979708 RepID=A0A9P6EX71_9FUNG|nr:hypothetical protein EC957_009144 [Mortierella hygrophila]
MKDGYHKNFDDYSGLSWVLPSSINVDTVIHLQTVADLFSSKDQIVVLQKLTRKKDGGPATGAETAFVSLYLSTPHKTPTALSRGWQLSSDSTLDSTAEMSLFHAMMQIYMAYQQEALRLSTSKSESWYTTTLWAFLPTILKMGGQLDHKPGEVVSEASDLSALRKNVDRYLESRRMQERKLNRMISCSIKNLKLGAIEAAKVDAGPQGAKPQSDSRKLTKVMKDTHHCVAVKVRDDIRNKLETLSLLLSRNKVKL